MKFEEKLSIYNNLNNEQKNKLKEVLKEFDSCMWLVEPVEELYGVEWTHTDLRNIINNN